MTGQPHDAAADDATLLAGLRALWNELDPVPDDLADRVVAAIAIDDLSRNWELLSLLEDAALGSVRGEAESRTLQFGDATTNVLLHLSATGTGHHRIDGWVDATVLAVRLVTGSREESTRPTDSGRFAFGSVPTGPAQLRLVTKDGETLREFMTTQFDV